MTLYTVIMLALLAAVGITLWIVFRRWQNDIEAHQNERSTWQRLMQDQLLQERDDRDRLLNALSDAFLLVDENQRIRFANEAASELCNSQSLANRTLRETFIDPRLTGALIKGLESEDPIRTRITLSEHASPRRKAENRGISAWIIDTARLPAHGKFPPLTRIIIRDITPEYLAEQIRKDFVANASHELRTPMAIINGYLENLLDDDMLEDRETSKRFLTVMRKHAGRMSRIIEDMLVISRLESGEENPLNIEPFKLLDCIQDTLERLESLIRAQQAEIQIKLSDDGMVIHGDRFYWTQALFNLIENALKQNPRPGLKIQIGGDLEGGRQRIWVSDNGIGIPRSDLPFIFRRFYRVDKNHTQSEIKGTGLGLSIVKRAIEAHDGIITATSTPGTETKFLISVPITPSQRPALEL